MEIQEDSKELCALLNSHRVEYVVVGGDKIGLAAGGGKVGELYAGPEREAVVSHLISLIVPQ
jgi:hypothetical protein